jgi:hypothetical protein
MGDAGAVRALRGGRRGRWLWEEKVGEGETGWLAGAVVGRVRAGV